MIFCSYYNFKLLVIFNLLKHNFNIYTKYAYKTDIHKSRIIQKPTNLASMNKVSTNIRIILNREENHLNTSDSHIEIEFDVNDNAAAEIANNANRGLVNYCVVTLFSSFKI